MTSKEYFRQAYRLDQRINLNIAELDELRAMACNITSSALSEKVARSRDGNAPFVKAIERITKLEQEIDAEVDTFVNLKTEMRGVIESVEDRNEQLILHYRYILNYTYRFTEGHVYYRSYSGGTWGSWQDLLTLIPNNTITTDMIQSGAVTANELEEGYMRAFSGEDLSYINTWDAGIYTGELGENWRARYGYTGHYIVIADEIQLMIIPEVQRIRYRYRNYARIWGDWIDIDFVTLEDVNNAVHGESGTIGTNYAWYTDQSQGLSLTGTYTLIGDFCTINGTCPLIEGWNTVYYSLPCASLYSAATIARCGSAVLSVVTNTLNNVSVLEIKKLDGGALPSGTISFTLTYRYQQYE